MYRLLLALLIIGLFPILSLYAHEFELDGLGCHVGDGGHYHCHSGPLSGRTFANKKAAVNAMVKLTEAKNEAVPPDKADTSPIKPAKPSLKLSDLDPVKVIFWRAPNMGRENFNFNQIAQLVAQADIIAFSEMSLTNLSLIALKTLQKKIAESLGETICFAIAKADKNSKTRSGFLWKSKKVGFIRNNGFVKDTCDHEEITGVDYATFIVVHSKQLISVLLTNDSKSVVAITSLNQWPVIWAGDIDSKRSEFSYAFESLPVKLKSEGIGFARPKDNFGVRGLGIKDSRIIDLYADYPDLDVDQIRTKFSNHCPIYAEFHFQYDELEKKE